MKFHETHGHTESNVCTNFVDDFFLNRNVHGCSRLLEAGRSCFNDDKRKLPKMYLHPVLEDGLHRFRQKRQINMFLARVNGWEGTYSGNGMHFCSTVMCSV